MTIFAVPLSTDQAVGGLGKAHWMAVGTLQAGEISDWAEHLVEWDVLHDVGTHGGHHARIVTFLKDNNVDHIVAGHIGEPMQNTLTKLGVAFTFVPERDPKAAVLAAFSA